MNRNHGDRDEREEQFIETPVIPEPRRSPLAQLQRSVGNARLLQMRAMQRRDLAEEARALSAARAGERKQEEEQRLAAAGEQMTVPAGGSPLAPALQAQAEARHGVRMDDVRVVNDSASTSAIQAHAYTTTDGGTPKVVLNSTQDPASSEGKFTLMHELAHVAQQKKGLSDGLDGLGGDAGKREELEKQADDHAGHMCNDPGHKH
jgi:1-aminocyclopropane-1-carboxylate deaminase/D-cysteine desulfhydrase-like pyridoxal-dependent ACC family enzyme